jgi:CCAAT/enhancer binding protein (C/EBP) gamma
MDPKREENASARRGKKRQAEKDADGNASAPRGRKQPKKGTDEYLKKRERNNEAVRRCRLKKKESKNDTIATINRLREENKMLEAKIAILRQESAHLERIFANALHSDDDSVPEQLSAEDDVQGEEEDGDRPEDTCRRALPYFRS